ncbi:MAG: cytosine permease [Microbacterium sp.]|nr:cytosine permease [Microbacterium sp.]
MTASSRAEASLLERRTIDMVPASERHGTPRSQFTLWFGANMQITAVVTGALAVILGASGPSAVLGIAIGNVIGGVFMALHAAQGPRLGLPQMISSRVQFGVRGAALPLLLVILMYLGFASTGAVLAGQAIDAMLGIDVPAVGILIFGVLTAVVAIFGYRVIHVLGRIATVVGLLGFAYLAFQLFAQYDVAAAFTKGSFDIVPFITAVTLAAGWQMTYAPYVADYSRYLPASTPPQATFWASFSGSVVGTQIAMTFGVLIALVGGDEFLGNQVGFLGTLANGAVPAVLTYLVIVVGKLTVNCLNAYGGFMTVLTTVTGFNDTRRISQRTRSLVILAFVGVSLVIALAASADFLHFFKNFVLLLLAVFIPWSVVNLTDYYLISKERVDIPALYDARKRYGSVNMVAVVSYLVGVLVQIPFLSQTLYTGPIAAAMGGLDISWAVSLVVTFPLYYFWARRTQNFPQEMIYPEATTANPVISSDAVEVEA